MVQPFDAATLTLSGEPRQLVENIRVDPTQGLTNVSVSETGALSTGAPLGKRRSAGWSGWTGPGGKSGSSTHANL